jgi:hypothetical protein
LFKFRDEFGQTPIFIAIKKKHFDLVEDLILFGGDISIKDSKGSTILHDCLIDGKEYNLRKGDKETLSFIIKIMKKQSISLYNSRDNSQNTPVLVGVINGNIECLKEFLSNENVNINVINSIKQNIFHLAAIYDTGDCFTSSSERLKKSKIINDFDGYTGKIKKK